MTSQKARAASKKKSRSRKQISRQSYRLFEKIAGMKTTEARALTSIGILTLEDLRDADPEVVVEQLERLDHAVVQRWQQQALLQTVFAGLGPRQAKLLVNAGITTIPEMAEVNVTQLRGRINETHLQAWKFIACKIPSNILPERLETAEGVESLSPPQAAALYAQGIKNLQQLRGAAAEQLDFKRLPTITPQKLNHWKYLAELRLDFGVGPAYAQQVYVRYRGNRRNISRHLQREQTKALAKIPVQQTVRMRGRDASSSFTEKETADFHLQASCRELAHAVSSGEPRKIDVTLRGAKQWGSASEISGLLLQRLGVDTGLDKSKVVSWLTKNQLTSRRSLLELVAGFVENKKGQQELLKTLADQFGLGAVLSDIGKSASKDSLLGLVTKAVENWQNLILELPKLGGAAAQVIDELAGEKKIKPAEMIGAVLQSDKPQKESILQTLVNGLQEKNFFDRDSTILELYKKKADFIQPFLKSLFKVGKVTSEKIDELFNLPLNAFSKDSERDREGVFSAIFRAVSEFSAEHDDFHDMMSALAKWLRETDQQDWVPVINDGLAPGADAACVPLRFHLLGAGLRSYLNENGEPQQMADQFAGNLLDHLPLKEGGLEEEIWLHLAKIPGLLFVLFPKMLLRAIATPMKVFQWIGQEAGSIVQTDRKLNILTLPPPDKNHKYAILSDVHRDAPEDLVDEIFFDLSHFSKNRDLFIRALEYYSRNGYIVIENGDCEELWVAPSVKNNKGVRARAEGIISPDGPHRRVYEILADLHRQGRYFRTRGNHDDFWALSPENSNLLKEAWFRDGPVEFKIWDALIIPNVLTMKDDYLGILKRITKAKKENKPIEIDELVDLFPVGLSPYRYRDRAPLFILHGHQTDFWNCDEHNFLGKILANSLGIIADGMTTFPYHLKGVDFGGRPILDFEEILLEIPQVNSWLPEDPALRLSRRIEQSDYKDRQVIDGITYSETFTAALSLALKYPGQKGLQHVQILIGHTHWPQSRPHLFLGMLNVPHLKKDIPLRLPTPYYNSGTCGWWEGVLWGMEVTDFGQPKLFYWEKKSNAPHYMPWELHDEIPQQALVFKEKIKKILEKFLNTAVLEEQTENLAAWEDVDDFSDLQKIDLSALDERQQVAALNTAYLWALRHLENRPRTSPVLEITLDLKNFSAPSSLPKRYELIANLFSNPHVLTLMLKSYGIPENWTTLQPRDELYYKVGSLFFYGAYVLRNSICNRMGLLLNMFISREREYGIRYSATQQLLSIQLGAIKKRT
jgi:hypothetical protein